MTMNTTQKISVGTLAAALVVAAFALLALPSLKESATDISHSLSEREHKRVAPYAFETAQNATSSAVIVTESFVPAEVVKRAVLGRTHRRPLPIRPPPLNHK